MKKSLIVVAIFIIAFFVIGIFKDQVIKAVVTQQATHIIGAPVHIGGFSLGIFSHTIRITGLRIYNPKGFRRGILVDIPKIKVDYDLGALLKKRMHLYSADFELKELCLQKNKQGQLNVDSLKVAGKGQQGGKPAPAMPMEIDKLKLGIGRIVYKDYSISAQPLVSVYNLNINNEYSNITSAAQLVALVLAEPLKNAGIEGVKIYGAAMLAGVAFPPVAAIAALTGRDNAEKIFHASPNEVYNAALEVLKRQGRVSAENKATGTITASVNSVDIEVSINKAEGGVQAVVTARKYFFPKPEIAEGVIYEISEELR